MQTQREPRLRGRARAMHVLSLRGAEREEAFDAWTLDLARDLVLLPLDLPVLPFGAREYALHVSERAKGAGKGGSGDTRAVEQHARWCAQLFELLVVDGLKLARDVLVAGDFALALRLADRLERQVGALEALALPWWPELSNAGDRRPLGLPQYVRRGIDWTRTLAFEKRRPARPSGPDAQDDHARSAFAQALLGAGLDALETSRTRPPVRKEVEPLIPVKGGGEIVDPGADVTESRDEWEAP